VTRAELVAALRRSEPADSEVARLVDLERYVDESVREFDAEELWPWRPVEVTGAAPLTVTTLGPIDYVRDADLRPLTPRRKSELVEESRDLTEIGSAQNYYVEGSVVKTWPVSSTAITVRHYDQGGWVTGREAAGSDADTPRADVRWHDLILLLARLRAKEASEKYEAAAALWQRYQARLEQARQAELRDNWDEPDVIRTAECY
jgi:hypothetical protein